MAIYPSKRLQHKGDMAIHPLQEASTQTGYGHIPPPRGLNARGKWAKGKGEPLAGDAIKPRGLEKFSLAGIREG